MDSSCKIFVKLYGIMCYELVLLFLICGILLKSFSLSLTLTLTSSSDSLCCPGSWLCPPSCLFPVTWRSADPPETASPGSASPLPVGHGPAPVAVDPPPQTSDSSPHTTDLTGISPIKKAFLNKKYSLF